jgi:hypothetical protein
MGGDYRPEDMEATLGEDGRTVMVLLEVRPDQYAIASFELASRQTTRSSRRNGDENR